MTAAYQIGTSAEEALETFVASIDFARSGGLVPTIVCDAAGGRPRMLAYSSPESLRISLRDGYATYWSRSRGKLWKKGETLGNFQRLREVRVDCDGDALLFSVEQNGPACHTGAQRCFGDAEFTWQDLMTRIATRAQDNDPARSYTARLLGDPSLLASKIREEAEEVIQANTRDEVAWECADLLYFMSVRMQQAGIGIGDVCAQLAARAVTP